LKAIGVAGLSLLVKYFFRLLRARKLFKLNKNQTRLPSRLTREPGGREIRHVIIQIRAREAGEGKHSSANARQISAVKIAEKESTDRKSQYLFV
jgi:hypothetical protein